MNYMLLIYMDENRRRTGTLLQRVRPICARAFEQREIFGCSAATSDVNGESVRVRDGKQLITDGPFAETREQLGGYFLIDAKNLDEAISVAKKIPGQAWGNS